MPRSENADSRAGGHRHERRPARQGAFAVRRRDRGAVPEAAREDPVEPALDTAHSAEFRRIRDSGEVVMCAAGSKRPRHPVAGLLTLDFETLHVPAAPGETGLVVHVFSAEERSAEAAALARLTETVTVTDRP
ncbi:hypothetical protein ACFRU3_19935 [Streptomyces sp. NPDC056910]|uniref:MmyB family transcriptional regulator n=1 Tax=Streptomyces sp. NPDC056910 TaxID=3345964 RepID=UPI00369428DE